MCFTILTQDTQILKRQRAGKYYVKSEERDDLLKIFIKKRMDQCQYATPTKNWGACVIMMVLIVQLYSKQQMLNFNSNSLVILSDFIDLQILELCTGAVALHFKRRQFTNN